MPVASVPSIKSYIHRKLEMTVAVVYVRPRKDRRGHRAVRVMARSRSEAEAAAFTSAPASASLRSPRSLHWPRPLFRARDRDGDKDGGRDGGRDGDTDRGRNRD